MYISQLKNHDLEVGTQIIVTNFLFIYIQELLFYIGTKLFIYIQELHF